MKQHQARRGQKLRIGILIDSDFQPAWIYQILSRIKASHFGEIVVILENRAAPPPTGLWERLRGAQPHHLLYDLYSRLDRLVARREATAFFERDLRSLLSGCPRLLVHPRQGRFTDELQGGDLERLAGYDLDVLLRFGFRALRGPVLQAARHGVWSYHHDDNRVLRGGPAGFYEVLRGDETSGCVLQVLGDDLDNGRVIDRAVVRTVQGSVRRNQNNVLWTSAGMMPRRLEELWRTGQVPAEAQDPRPDLYDRPLYTVPQNGAMARLLLGLASRGVAAGLDRLRHVRDWQLAYRLGPSEDLLSASLHRFRHLRPPRGSYWADPCSVRRDGRHFLFFEEYQYARRKGRILVLEIDPEGRPGPPRVALERSYHLSYPFLFSHRGQLYLMPESHKNGTIEVYRCRRFPCEWERAKVLLSGIEAVDPTLHVEDGTCYLFFATRAPGALDFDQLHVYFADDPLGEWREVPNSPIKIDVRSSRPAGGLLRSGGRLYRPAQDGAPHYGRAITLNEVVTLDRDRYEERPVSRIEPGWLPGQLGAHTLHHGDGLLAVDALCRTGRLARFMARLAEGRERLQALAATGGLPRPVPLGGAPAPRSSGTGARAAPAVL